MQDLIDKIQHYGDFGQRVRDKVMTQIERYKRLNLNRESIDKAVERVPAALEATEKFLDQCDKVRKTVSHLERHKYAPELNALHFKDTSWIYVHGITEIEEAIEYFVKTQKHEM